MKNPILKCIKIAVLIAFGIFVFGMVVMLLWNTLIPSIFGLREIVFWEAIGLLVLSKILFGGHGGWGKHCHGKHCGQNGGGHSYWKNKMMAKMEKMNDEEKEAFKKKLGKCGYGIDDNKE